MFLDIVLFFAKLLFNIVLAFAITVCVALFLHSEKIENAGIFGIVFGLMYFCFSWQIESLKNRIKELEGKND